MKKVIKSLLIFLLILISCSNANARKSDIPLTQYDMRYLINNDGEYLNTQISSDKKLGFIYYNDTNQNLTIFDIDSYETKNGYISGKSSHTEDTIGGNLNNFGFKGKINDREVNFESVKYSVSGAKIVEYSHISTKNLDEDSDIRTFEYRSSIFVLNNDEKLESIDKINSDINSYITNADLNDYSAIENIFSNYMYLNYVDWIDPEYMSDMVSYSYRYEIDYLSENIISINNFFYEYTGGIHGMYFTGHYVYSLSNGDRLEIEDILIDINDLSLLNKVKQKLLAKDDSEYYFDLENVSLKDNNFYITSKGLVFTWGIYEIAPYSSGEINVLMSIDEIKPYLKADYKNIFN